jgi:hypothetical protein
LYYAATFYFPIRISEKKEHDSLFMGNKKGGFVSLFLSLSLTHSTMLYKKRTSLFSVNIGTDSSNFGKIDTFKSIH